MASLSAAVKARLESAYAAANASLTGADRITVYEAMIPGTPTNRYAVVYAGEPRRAAEAFDGASRHVHGRFQVTVAATGPNSSSSPAGMTDWLVRATLAGLVDADLTVDGLTVFRVRQDEVDTYPVAVEVVADRPTVEQALLFVFDAARTS